MLTSKFDIAQVEDIVLCTYCIIKLIVGKGTWIYTRLNIVRHTHDIVIGWIIIQREGNCLD